MLRKLAGSKIPGTIGAAVTFLGTVVCTSMRDSVHEAAPVWGLRVCAIVIICAAAVAWFGKSPANRRTGQDLDTVKLPSGEIIANRRGSQ